MPKFKKKPVLIEAFQLPKINETCSDEMIDWLNSHDHDIESERDGVLLIHTLEGTMQANPEDWIIKGVEGELYPCKPSIFEAVYDPVE